MARIAGVDLPRNKRIEIGLTYIYGIGRTSSRRILEKLNIDLDLKTDHLTEDQISNIRKAIDDQYKVEGELRTEISMNIKRLMDFGSYRGLRHRKSLPVQHQCPHTEGTQTGCRQEEGCRQTEKVKDLKYKTEANRWPKKFVRRKR